MRYLWLLLIFIFFMLFIKQKTAYEMRISDWSSDVCSSDLTITDILVNGYNTVFIERYGLLEKAPTRFQDERHLLRIIQKIVSRVGRRVDESSPFVDARLADGSRVNAIIAPLAIAGSLLSIPKFSKHAIRLARTGERRGLRA